MRSPRPIWIVAGILFAVASVWIHCEVKVGMREKRGGAIRELGSVKVGQPAPDFAAPDLAGKTVTLAGYRGKKVVLLDFWATWCPPCKMALPDLQAMHDKYKDGDLEILSLDQGEPEEQVSRFAKRESYTLHMLLDSDSAIGARYGAQAIPTQVLVDKTGVVRWIRVGYIPSDPEMERLVERLVKE